MKKRLASFLIIGAFLAAFAAHPAVHAEDREAHVCLLLVAGPDRVSAPATLPHLQPVFSGRLSAALITLPRSGGFRLWDARGPPPLHA